MADRSTSNIRSTANPVILPLRPTNLNMTQSESDRIQELCSKIAVEQDRQKFLQLVQELNRLLSAKDGRLHERDSQRKDD